MQVTYITHSCFLVETQNSLFLFDYFEGELPALDTSKPLYCFASHSHGDHFSERLFEATSPHPNAHYILSDDIFKSRIPQELTAKTDFIAPAQIIVLDGMSIKALKSTDMGVAFVIDENGTLIYHAGDLNCWQWEEESDEYNRTMEQNYIKEIEKLDGLHFKLAFIPLDPRQGEDIRQKGIKIFLEYANAENIFPMHLWDNYDIAPALAAQMGTEEAELMRCCSHKNEVFEITED